MFSAPMATISALINKNKLNYEARKELLDGSTFKRADFFKDYFWTRTGKKMAKRRFNFYLEYLDRLQEEVVEQNLLNLEI